jgi:hypothetical protein
VGRGENRERILRRIERELRKKREEWMRERGRRHYREG